MMAVSTQSAANTRLLNTTQFLTLSLVVIFILPFNVGLADTQIESAIEAVQLEIQHAQSAFAQVRKSNGGSTQGFNVATTNLRNRINTLNATLRRSERALSSKEISLNVSRLNTSFQSLSKAHSQRDWREVERDLARLESSAKDLYSSSLRIPGAPDTGSRKPPAPPASGPSGSKSVPTKPTLKPDPVPGPVVPHKPPPTTGRGPSPKGPDDPRFVAAPGPVVPIKDEDPLPQPPPPKPPSGERGSSSSKPMPDDEHTGRGSPPMMRKPARPPVKAEDEIPKPKPIPSQDSPKIDPAIGHLSAQGENQQSVFAQKTKNFLQSLQSAKSIEQVRQAYQSGNFTELETKKLEQQVLAGGYNQNLDMLFELEKPKSPSVTNRTLEVFLHEKRSALNQKKEVELKRLNAQALAVLDQLKSENSTMSRGTTVPGNLDKVPSSNLDSNTRAVDIETRGEHLPPREEIGEILSIQGTVPLDQDVFSEDQGTTGSSIIIIGNYFGSEAGEVSFYPNSLRDQRRSIPISVSYWNEHRIVGQIPLQEVGTILGSGNHPGRIVVKRQGADSGPGREFTLVSRLPGPQITHTSTASGSLGEGVITPGQTIIIVGRYFSESFAEYIQGPSVQLELTHPTGSVITTFLQVNEFDDTWISAELGTIEGVSESRGKLKVLRGSIESPPVWIDFRPTLSTWVFVEGKDHRCKSIFGWKNTVTLHDRNLKNGWKVVSHDTQESGAGGYGCNWIERPSEGSTESAARLEIWCDLYSWVSCNSEVTIEGPAGVSWH